MTEDFKIECPKCGWQPQANDQWQCTCGHHWNTFETTGRCPACKKQWMDTRCFPHWDGGCHQWSPHLDWYKGLDETLRVAWQEIMADEAVEV